MTLAWFHCLSGATGPRLLAALLDAGASLTEVEVLCRRVPVFGWRLRIGSVERCGVLATEVSFDVEASPVVRTYAHLTGLLGEARLPPRVRDRSLSAFRLLAEAEAATLHRPPEHIHFHEIGALDAIIDIVGTCAALEVLGVDEVHASAVATGVGWTRGPHGTVPVPTPTTLRLLSGVPTVGFDEPGELTSSIGAALLRTLASSFGPMPPTLVRSSGRGSGAEDGSGTPPLTVVIGQAVEVDELDDGPERPPLARVVAFRHPSTVHPSAGFEPDPDPDSA